MSYPPTVVELILRDASGKEVDRTTIEVPPGDYKFSGLSPGSHSIECILPKGTYFNGNNPWYETPGDDGIIAGNIIRRLYGNSQTSRPSISPIRPDPPPDRTPPLPEAIAVTAASLVLMGNIALFEDFVLEDFISSLRPNRTAPTEQSRTPSESELRDPRNRLSPAVEERLRECLIANIKRIAGVPDLTELVQNLTKDNEDLNTDFQVEVRQLYKNVKQLRQIIEECDPTLIEELMKADEKIVEGRKEQEQGQNECNHTAIIVGQLVNVRAFPSSDSEVIAQFAYGSCIQLDIDALNSFSDERRSDAESGKGWYPIILPDGGRGYVYSRYVRRSLVYRF